MQIGGSGGWAGQAGPEGLGRELVSGVTLPPALSETFCGAAHTAAQVIAPEEGLLRVLEAAVAQLHQVVDELRVVSTGTHQLSLRVESLLAIDWRSPAGEAFADRTGRLRVRADELAKVADELTATARAGIDELHGRIQQARSDIAAAKAAVLTLATGGVC